MKITFADKEYEVEDNPDVLGEMFRGMFFEEDRENGKLGCYNTFELREGVNRLPDIVQDGITITCADLNDIRMFYSWDGDGDLSFYLPDGRELNNSDCKKTYGWEFI